MGSSRTNRMITVKSYDGEVFEISEQVAMQAKTLRHMIEDDCAEGIIPLPNVTAKILAKVIEYCKWQIDASSNLSDEEKREWEKLFLDVDKFTLAELILAANYLEIKALLDLGCQRVADMITGKTPEEIREIFRIKNDFTPEEEEAFRQENLWAFQ